MNKKKKTLLICLSILLVGGGLTAFIFFTEPTATREGTTKETAMLVEVTEVQRGTYAPTIVATGSVQPSQDILLSPRVSGEVVSRSPDFIPGGFVRQGEVLLQIDPADYQNILELRRSDLRQAMADLQIEEGRQDVARRDYQLVDEELPEINEDLVLREPQLNAVKARVEAARAAVGQAELQLQRTSIKAPFDAHILSRNVNVGSQVAPGDELGRLVGREVYWVVVTVPLSKLRWLSFPTEEGEEGSPVRIHDRKAWEEGAYRKGYLFRLVGALEEQTRMARVLVAVPDPLGYRNDTTELPPLMINGFVEARIQGKEVKEVIRLNRDKLRQNDQVWVMEADSLRIRQVDIVLKDAEYAYIAAGLQEGDLVVETNLSTVAEGVKLRRKEADSTATEKDTLPEETPQKQQEK